ncbi:hypothetical protein G9A89_010231 [Geosiphon pyriformis]|nr:hypothetical protein G9A89_010231 [Geosiphon pyriformis]
MGYEVFAVIDTTVNYENGTVDTEHIIATIETFSKRRAVNNQQKLTYIYTSGLWIHGDNISEIVTENTPLNNIPPFLSWRVPIEQKVISSSNFNGIVICRGIIYGKSGSLAGLWFPNLRVVTDVLRFLLNISSYETFKIVKVQDKRLGVIYRTFQIGIFAYIIYSIIKNLGYLKKEPPVPGAVRLSLKAPDFEKALDNFTNPEYCNSDISCVYWGANEIYYPNDGPGVAFFTTRAVVKKYPPNDCNFLTASQPNNQSCFFDPKSTPYELIVNKSYIGHIEDYTIMIEHSIRGKATSIGLRNGLMDGKLVNHKGKVLKSWTNATRTADNPKADGDILTIRQILDAAGADLDAISSAPGADSRETYRSSGLVIVVVIEYINVPFKDNVITYTYYPQMIDGNEYKTVESIYGGDKSYILKERHGIRLVFQQYGSIGVFDFITLLQNIVAGFALFSLATLIVEILMLQLLPEKKDYEEWKFETTQDFDQNRKEKRKHQKPQDELELSMVYDNQPNIVENL